MTEINKTSAMQLVIFAKLRQNFPLHNLLNEIEMAIY